MPNCFQLTRIGSSEPASFQQIDNAICQNLDLPWDPKHWVEGWYDIIGFSLAMGKSFEQITDYLNKRIIELSPKPDDLDCVVDVDWIAHYRTLLHINHFLLENYTADSWVEIGRRN